jgi:C2 domain
MNEEMTTANNDDWDRLALAVADHPGRGERASGHRLRVTLYEANGIRSTNYFSNTSDSYVEVGLLGSAESAKTSLCRDTTEPQWNEQFDLTLGSAPLHDVVAMVVRGRHVIGRDDFIGRVEMPVSLLLAVAATRDARSIESCWFKLLPMRTLFKEPASSVTGTLRVGLEYFFDPMPDQREILSQTLADRQQRAAAGGEQPQQEQQEQCAICRQFVPSPLLERHVEVHINQQQTNSGVEQQQQQQQQQRQVRAVVTATPEQEERDLSLAIAASLSQQRQSRPMPMPMQQQTTHATAPPQYIDEASPFYPPSMRNIVYPSVL